MPMSSMETQMTTHDAVHALKTYLLSRYGGRELTGADLGPLVKSFVDYRAEYPTLTSGWLSQYVLDHLSDVLVEVGRKGLDRVFRVGADAGATEHPLPTTYWHAFASTSAPYKLVANPGDGTWQLLQRSSEVQPGLVEVASMSREELLSIASAFLEAHIGDSDARSQLLQLYQGDYGYWRERLTAAAPEAATKWAGYRQTAIVDHCRRRLDSARVPAEVVSSLLEELVRSRVEPVARGRAAVQRVAARPRMFSLGPSRNALPAGDLRDVAAAALERMTLGELEGVAIPLRVVFELLQERRNGRA